MARIAESEIERLKADVSLLRLIEDAGLVPVRQGKDYAACCPFEIWHNLRTQSDGKIFCFVLR